MKVMKLYESFSRPSNKELAETIVSYVTKFPKKLIIKQKINRMLQIPLEDIMDYNLVYQHLESPAIPAGSGSKKHEFVSENYLKMKMEVSENMDIIIDSFEDIFPNIKVLVWADADNNIYKATITKFKVSDLPNLMRILIRTVSNRMPETCVLETISYNLTSKSINISILSV